MNGCLKSALGQEYLSLESIAFLTVAVVNFQILQQLKDNLSQCLMCGQSHKFYKALFSPQKKLVGLCRVRSLMLAVVGAFFLLLFVLLLLFIFLSSNISI